MSAVQLAQSLRAGMRSATSVHLRMTIGVAGQTVAATGDQALADGAMTSARLDETIPGFGALTIVIVGKSVYVKLPPTYAGSTAKPWFLVTPTSSNTFVKAFSATVGSILNSASLTNFTAFAQAARDITVVGPSSDGGVPATEYSLQIDVSSLPTDFPNRAALQRAGLTTLPLHLWLDAHNRTVRATETVAVQGQQVESDVRLSDYDKPVTITRPPAGQIAER